MSSIFSDLIDAYLTDTLNAEEEIAFLEMLNNPENRIKLDYIIGEKMDNEDFAVVRDDDRKAANLVRLQKRINELNEEPHSPAPAIHILKTTWFRYAAAVIICFGIGVYLWNTSHKRDHLTTQNNTRLLQKDIAPGGEKAILTLADGTEIILANAANGNIAQQGNTEVVKLTNGQIAYNIKGLSDKNIKWNTMSTPAGGQYQVLLPDGTKAWLNAASSITYPVAFVSKDRQVKITGEVYFEVAKNKEKPFIVDIDGKSTVEVLGTSFNINSYTDEESVKTTLLEGSVRVSNDHHNPVILNPGYQAVIVSDQQFRIIAADLEQTVAWKNGIFDFNGADLKSVMRQLERWYDIKVQYQGSLSNMTFEGRMYRNVNLSDVLEALQKMGVKFRMEGKTLIVL